MSEHLDYFSISTSQSSDLESILLYTIIILLSGSIHLHSDA